MLDVLYDYLAEREDLPFDTDELSERFSILCDSFFTSKDDALIAALTDYEVESRRNAFKVGFNTAVRLLSGALNDTH